MTTEVTVIWWRAIPAQVQVGSGRTRTRREMPARFQVAIDRAAMEAGLIGTDDYLTEWKRDTATVAIDDPEEACDRMVDDLDRRYPSERLQRIAGNGGIEEVR